MRNESKDRSYLKKKSNLITFLQIKKIILVEASGILMVQIGNSLKKD